MGLISALSISSRDPRNNTPEAIEGPFKCPSQGTYLGLPCPPPASLLNAPVVRPETGMLHLTFHGQLAKSPSFPPFPHSESPPNRWCTKSRAGKPRDPLPHQEVLAEGLPSVTCLLGADPGVPAGMQVGYLVGVGGEG